MTPEEEKVLAVAMLLRPDAFANMGTAYGHVPKVRERSLKRAQRLISLVRLLDDEEEWVRVPVPPTPEILDEMSRATFLRDGSRLEMERRFNGILRALGRRA